MQARPHVGEIGRDRIGERQFRRCRRRTVRPAACGDERPGHRLDQAARGERALGLAGAQLDGVSTGLRGASPRVERRRRARGRRRRCARPPRRGRPCPRRPAARTAPRPSRVSPCAGDVKAELLEDALRLRRRTRRGRRGASPRRAGNRSTLLGDLGTSPATIDLGRRAAAEVEHHLGREFEARQHEGRIDAALEAVARIAN